VKDPSAAGEPASRERLMQWLWLDYDPQRDEAPPPSRRAAARLQ